MNVTRTLSFLVRPFALAVLAGCNFQLPNLGSPPSASPSSAPATGSSAAPVVSETIPPAFSNRQVIRVASPKTAMGTTTDATFGVVAGYTLGTFSQTLAFAPNTQVLIANENTLGGGKPHTLNVLSTSAFPSPAPAPSGGTALPLAAAGGNTLSVGYASGSIAPGTFVGPVVLMQGTYFVGCAYHYPDNHRDVIVVQANATPGPEGTAPAGSAAPPSDSRTVGGY